MPVFAFTVGSFGDIVTTIVFLAQIAVLFFYSTEYSREYELLDEEVKTFTNTLAAIRRETQSSALDYTSKEVLDHTVATGDKVLAEIEEKEKIAGDHERNDGPFWWALRLRHALWWIIFGRKEVEHCRNRLRDQQTSMTAMIQALNRSSVYETRRIATSTQATQAAVSRIVESTAATEHRILVFQNLCQRHIHNIADPVDLQSSVFLVDLLGDKNVVPINFFESTQRLHKYLCLFFAGKAGGDFVRHKEYALSLKHKHPLSDWHQREFCESSHKDDDPLLARIRPGLTIYMSAVICESSSSFNRTSQYRRCPLCLTMNPDQGKALYQDIRCTHCSGLFQSGFRVPTTEVIKDSFRDVSYDRLRFVRRVYVDLGLRSKLAFQEYNKAANGWEKLILRSSPSSSDPLPTYTKGVETTETNE